MINRHKSRQLNHPLKQRSIISREIITKQMREDRIENQLLEIRQLGWAQVIQCSPKGIERDDLWIVWIPGRKGTLWEGGIYPVEITFPPQYPKLGPIIQFETDFEHVHVYEGGAICLPLIEAQYWRSKTSMTDILQRIASLIHQDVNQYSPANMEIFRIYKQNRAEYQAKIKSQALKHSSKKERYFQQPCIHINLLLQQ